MENLGGAKLFDDQEKRNKRIDDNEKRYAHKEIERQRRKDMASLYASLRSQLPLEYIKGKRSISDHMHQAVNYIKHLEKNIKELEIKRVRMKDISHSNALPHTSQCSNNYFENCIKISSCDGHAVEILISSCLKEEGFMLSKVLEVLLQHGLDVLAYTCTTINGTLFHMIKAEVCGTVAIELTMLQNKLKQIVHQNLG